MSLITRSGPRRKVFCAVKALLRREGGRRNLTMRELDDAKGGIERVVILGSGWAGFVLSRTLNPKKFQIVVVAPRSNFIFTPLLASTAVGTLEFRTALESVRSRNATVEYFQGWADDVDFNKKTVTIEEAVTKERKVPAALPSSSTPPATVDHSSSNSLVSKKRATYDISYDKLVVSVGCYNQTFGTKGVREHAFFLKDMRGARKIRKRILQLFEIAASPSTTEEVRKQALNFAIVGGGPTGIEFAAELHDLVHEDLSSLYPTLTPLVQISVYDVAPHILSMFDASLAEYATQKFKRDGIKVKTEHHIEELRLGSPGSYPADDESPIIFTLKTKEEGEVGTGMVVWSTGLMMNPFVQKALTTVQTYPTTSVSLSSTPLSPPSDLKWSLQRHPKTGGLMVNDRFQVLLSTPQDPKIEAKMHDVFALGDVSSFRSGPLTATAQVANQEAKWLGKHLNVGDIEERVFTFRNLGIMAYLGNSNAIMQTGEGFTAGIRAIKGRAAWVIWRGAYLTKTVSLRNKLLIPILWSINWVLGRDTSRF